MRQVNCPNSTLERRQSRSNEICLVVADVSVGSKPEVIAPARHVRPTFNSGHRQAIRHVRFVLMTDLQPQLEAGSLLGHHSLDFDLVGDGTELLSGVEPNDEARAAPELNVIRVE
jgi:hypothetical protein